jgi:four helix bundle protein
MRRYGFEKLEVWQEAKGLAVLVYNVTSKFPSSESFGLTSQLRRAIVSVSSNIAEGSSRSTKRDQAHFYTMAYSSLMEVLSQLLLAGDLGFIQEDSIDRLRPVIEKVTNKLNALRKAALSST